MIYLDHHATTPCDPRVLDAMWPWFAREYGNPHGTEHAMGRRAADAVEAARADVAALIGASPSEIVFTSGATEANNLAIKGAARFAGAHGTDPERRRIVTAANEHKCVLEAVRDLAVEGCDPVLLPVRPDGTLDGAALAEALRTPTLLVSIMAAHNETGRLQEIPALARLAHESGAKFHSDLAQAAGRISVDVRGWGVDAASLSAHKLYGPKGIGALFVRRHPRMRLQPLFSGGGQERGLRSGTLPVPLVVGFGTACRIARDSLAEEAARIAALRTRMREALQDYLPGTLVNGPMEPRLPGNLSLRFPGISAAALIAACPDLAVSTGSACTAAEIAPSHALLALGLTREEAASTLRVGIGRFTSAADVDTAARMLADAARRLSKTQPRPEPNHAQDDFRGKERAGT